ncbi:MAG: multidrug ABC transporter permease [Deltaproteobacteria bacterium HGW-Deltaproteobacteria-8]|jgi:ABC-type antimicrobial peptide transport system permease subunit|nr:MAG: multidrug ABC transporter permease [Deltaproteobacteria bacterium HGW-Deltaproteobacteria-8]
MALLVSYSLRNLLARRMTTALTAGGMALVVFVFAAALMLAEGLRATLVQTGTAGNALALRKGSKSEIESVVDRGIAALVETRPEIARDADGSPLAAREVVVLINLAKRGTGEASNVMLRGIGEKSLGLRPQVRLKSGRMPRFGSLEIIAGEGVARRFKGAGLGEKLRFGMRQWTVVGIFDAGATGFNSEIWGDVDQFMNAFRRNAYTLILVRLAREDALAAFQAGLGADPRLQLDVKAETVFYAEQSEMMAKFLKILGVSLTAIFSIGAMIGAMITMHAAVAGRTGEIGTLRALGFPRRSILWAFVLEALFLGLLGGSVGLLAASGLQLFTISTMNFQTFSELAFGFALTPGIVLLSLAFGTGMGLLGGLIPALRAARIKIVDALRAA